MRVALLIEMTMRLKDGSCEVKQTVIFMMRFEDNKNKIFLDRRWT